MRRKSERTKKGKTSPEKPEKIKKTRTSRRRKASSSEVESEDESSPQVPDVAETTNDQSEAQGSSDEKVWQVKSDDSSGTGEIKKLKICLSTRMPVTPEPESTPRRKKLNRTISDTPSEGTEKRHKHRSRRSTRESRESTALEIPSEEDITNVTERSDKECIETEKVSEVSDSGPKSNAPSVDSESVSSSLQNEVETGSSLKEVTDISSEVVEDKKLKPAPLTPISKRRKSRRLSGSSPEREPSPEKEAVKLPQISEEPEQNVTEVQVSTVGKTEPMDQENKDDTTNTQKEQISKVSDVSESMQNDEPVNKSDSSSIIEGNTNSENKSQSIKSAFPVKPIEDLKSSDKLETSQDTEQMETEISNTLKESSVCMEEVSKTPETVETSKLPETDEVFEEKHSRQSKYSSEKDTHHNSISKDQLENHSEINDAHENSKNNEEPEVYNSTPIVVSRKRKWGTCAKTSTQRPVSISTDILKDIIPDVKPAELEEAIADKKPRQKSESQEKPKSDRPILPKIVIDNSENANSYRREREKELKEKAEPVALNEHRKISIVKENNVVARPPSPARNKTSSVLFITNLVRPFTLAQLKNLLQRTGKMIPEGFWIDRIKSKCFVTYENEEQAVETRHALHGVTWPVSNPKTLQVDFSSSEALEKMRAAEEQGQEKVNTVPGTVEDWMREQDAKKQRLAETESKPWEKRSVTREWDMGKGEKEREKSKREERLPEKHKMRSTERSPEPVRKLKRKEDEPPAKMLDDLFRKTKTMPCIYWLPLSDETIAIKEEQRRQHMAEHERRMQEMERARTHRHH